jgi:hypothetical protein
MPQKSNITNKSVTYYKNEHCMIQFIKSSLKRQACFVKKNTFWLKKILPAIFVQKKSPWPACRPRGKRYPFLEGE